MMNDSTRILIIETSGRVGKVGIAEGSRLIMAESFKSELKHAAQLLPAMDRLCRAHNWSPNDIEHVYVSAGPGSFTGIRIGITVAKTLAFARSVKIVSVPSLEALALNAVRPNNQKTCVIKNLAVVLQAGRGHVFTAIFEYQPDNVSLEATENDNLSKEPKICCKDAGVGILPGFRILINQTIMTPAELLAQTKRPLFLLGEGLNYYRSELAADGENVIWLDEKYWYSEVEFVHCCGLCRARVGLFAQPDQLTPIYLRRPEAVEKWEELHENKEDSA